MTSQTADSSEKDGERMGFDDLNEIDLKVYEYIKAHDFENYPWDTEQAAAYLDIPEDEIYQSLTNLAKYIRDNIWIHYKDGHIRISAE